MHGQGGDATVLKLLGEVGDDYIVAVPAKARLDSDRKPDGFDDLARYLEHQRNITQHSGAGPFMGHLLHGTSEIDVDEVRAGLFYKERGLDHRGYVAAIYLNGRRALAGIYRKLAGCGCDRAYQSVGADKFAVGRRSALLFADQAERAVGDVFHRRQNNRTFSEVDMCDLHYDDEISKKE